MPTTSNRCASACVLRANDGQSRHPYAAGDADVVDEVTQHLADEGSQQAALGFIAEIEQAYASIAMRRPVQRACAIEQSARATMLPDVAIVPCVESRRFAFHP